MPMGLVLRRELEYRSAISGPTRRLAQAARHDNWCAAPDHFKGGFVRLNVSTAIFQLAPAFRHKMTYFPSTSCEFMLLIDLPISKAASLPRLCTWVVVSLRLLTSLTLFCQNNSMAARPCMKSPLLGRR